jgi:sugar phosphate isomerase/epimerase
MATIIYNPTNEVLIGEHSGVTLIVNPEDKIKIEDSKAKHLLNKLGRRGLSVLDYGCDEKKVGEEGIERNIDFKKKQVIEYNQRNESRKMQSMSYLMPTKSVKAYAIELGIELNEPYSLKDAEKEAITETKKENTELKKQINNLEDKLTQILDSLPPVEKTR